jgi:glycosyltransferase involved in cell wall biosynthesis
MTIGQFLGRKIRRLGGRLRRRLFPPPAPPAPAPWRKPEGPEKDVTVIGYLRAASGNGESGRQSLKSLEVGGLTVEGCDVSLGVASIRNDESCDSLLVETSTARAQIFNINADQLPFVVAHMEQRLRPDAKRICIPFWELTRFPDEWIAGLNAMDEIWAPSHFILQMLQPRLGEKTIYMPASLEFTAPPPVARAKFNLPENRFLFFFAFDFLSYIERKNPRAAIAAFRKAFPQRGRAGLVLKCANGTIAPERHANFLRECADDPDIFLIDETLTRTDTLALIAATDALISLHRSEGLGLLIGEAMLLGKPVIATDYSASQDMLSPATGYPVKYELIPVTEGQYPFAKGQVWAEADTDHAAALMRDLCEDPMRAQTRVAQARAHMQEHYSCQTVGRLQAARLRSLCG